MRPFPILCLSLSVFFVSCGSDESTTDTDTQNTASFPIADGPVSGLFADEAWTVTRGITGGLLGVELCSDAATDCEPCEGKQLNFSLPDAPGSVTLAAGGPSVNFYDGGGANVNAGTGVIVFDNVDGDTLTGGLFASYPYSSKAYEVSGRFTIKNCD